MPRFCANCGIDESSGVPIIDNLCLNCYVKLREVVRIPHSVDIPSCRKCGAILIEGKWLYPANSDEAFDIIKRYIASTVKPHDDVVVKDLDVEMIPPDFSRVHIHAYLLIKGRYSYNYEHDIEVKWVKQLCPVCFRRASRGYDAVVQLRFIHMDENIEIFKDTIESMFQDQLIEVEEVDNGFDFKVASPGIAKKIATIVKKYWKTVKIMESYGDVKRAKDGSRKAKLYISVKVLNLRVGDYVVIDGKAYIIEKVEEKNIVVVDSSGNTSIIDVDYLLNRYEGFRSKRR